MTRKNDTKITEGSGNVFADLGFADPELEEMKSKLVEQISNIIRSRRLTQVKAASILGIDQPKISTLLRGRFGGYSTDRLIRFLIALDQDIQLTIKSKPSRVKRHGAVSVMAA